MITDNYRIPFTSRFEEQLDTDGDSIVTGPVCSATVPPISARAGPDPVSTVIP
jgi:hypothetical protein